jgi:LmbE family N-acetylglucosaminyl deacetylase
MKADIQRILVVAPHTDDAELGMGATLYSLAHRKNTEIRIMALSDCVDSIPKGFPDTVLRDEAMQACVELDIPTSCLTIDSYPVRRFGDHRQDILEQLVRTKREYDPEVVFAPAATDLHQDHTVVRREVDRAFKDRSVFGYELPWNCKTFSAVHLTAVSEDAVRAKCRAIACYASQSGRPYSSADFTYALARVRGLQAGAVYAEAFDIGGSIWRMD